MKKALMLVLSLVLVFSLGACGSSDNGSPPSSTTGTEPQSSVVSENPSTPDISSSSQSNESEDAAEEDTSNESAPDDTSAEDSAASIAPKIEPASSTTDTDSSNASSTGSNILVAYFTVPESDGVDAVARASRVVVDGKVIGNTQFVAGVIQGATGGELFEIKTVQVYPARPDLMDLTANEQRQNARPELSTKIENPDQYNVIFLGYPNWWADLPQPLYTFLESYDFSGKTIVPFCPHGGSGFSNTISTIAQLQPNATVITEGFTVSRDRVANSSNDVIAWVQGLDILQ